MKILIAHSRIGSTAPSGENVVVETERRLLESRGHSVRVFEKRNDELVARGLLGALEAAVTAPWNPLAVRDIRREISASSPDIVHVHNTFPRLSPAVFPGLRGRVARVLTLHNYSIFCAGGLPLRAGQPCTLCLDQRSVLPALKHACYRGSIAATVPRAATVGLHRWIGTWQRDVDAFIALTEFQRELLVASGLPADRVHVRPNVFLGHPVPVAQEARRPYAVFAGRLTSEKGVHVLLDAWRRWGAGAPELRIIGDGADRAALEAQAPRGTVSFLGMLDPKETCRHIAEARALVLPSVVYEGFPMVIREAFAFGTPVVVSDWGPMPSIVRHGVAGAVFRGGDAESLTSVVRACWDDPHELRRLGAEGRRVYEAELAEDVGYRSLMDIYHAALAEAGRGSGART